VCAYIARLVVLVAVAEHEIEIIDAFLSIHVVERLEALLYRTHVHRICYNFIVVLAHKTQTGAATYPTAHQINTLTNLLLPLFSTVFVISILPSDMNQRYDLVIINFTY